MNEETIAKLCALGAFIIPPAILLVLIIKPELYIKWAVKYMKSSLKFFGMEIDGEIKYTQKTFRMFRAYCIILLLIMLVIWFNVGRMMLADL